jgi:hypothetical protein
MTSTQAIEIIENIDLTTAQWTALEWYFKNKKKGEGK